MTRESRPKAAPADAHDVGPDFTATGGQDAEVLTVRQRARWSPLRVDGILARPPSTAQAHDLALALGKVMRRDRTFQGLRNDGDMLCVEIRPSHRDKVLGLLDLSAWSWGQYVRRWEAVGLAHRCEELDRGAVRLFPRPEDICPVCGANVAGSNAERGSEQRSTLPSATETVLTAGDASGGEEGDVPSQRSTNDEETEAPDPNSTEQPSESAALAALKRAGITIGAPLSDEEVRALGYRPTSRGWVPIRGASMPRENAAARARRLLAERRVMIVRVLQASALAYVRGDSGELREVSWGPRRGRRCSCPAIGFCAHGHAVASVVAVPPASTAELLRETASLTAGGVDSLP